jgi:hypothetical protein
MLVQYSAPMIQAENPFNGGGSPDYVGWSAIAVNINANAGGGSPILMGAMCL